jgi:hypothetical protein
MSLHLQTSSFTNSLFASSASRRIALADTLTVGAIAGIPPAVPTRCSVVLLDTI